MRTNNLRNHAGKMTKEEARGWLVAKIASLIEQIEAREAEEQRRALADPEVETK